LDDPSVNTILVQSRRFYARYDNFPATKGHIEIVPKRHVVSFFELTPSEAREAYRLMAQAQRRLQEMYSPDGFTIGVNDGKAAGRSIDHLHIHVIPRYLGDVEDPRGGIRQIVPNYDPAAWIAAD
jgi:diadenosine tetraphosphate (Ap4A) HIT family hydrolase